MPDTRSPARPAGALSVRQTHVLLAVVHLHRQRPPATVPKVDRYLDRFHRRDVERAVHDLAGLGLVEIGPGTRNRALTPLVELVPHHDWASTDAATWLPNSVLPRLRAANRRAGCPCLLPDRFGRLCTACGEVVDAGGDTGVSSTP